MRNSLLILLLLSFSTISCEWIDQYGGGVITIDGLDGVNSATVSVTPCEHGVGLNLEDLPQAIRDYLNQQFPGVSVDRIELFQEEGTSAFGVRLGDGTEILFKPDGVVIRSSNDNSEREIRFDSLLTSIKDFITANYPNILIDHAETELEYGHSFIEIYLNDGTELYFDLEGNFLCRDDNGDSDHDWDDDNHSGNDNDDDDDHGNQDGDDDHDNDDQGGHHDDDDDDDDDDDQMNNVFSLIRDYVAANYTDYRIDELKNEDICDDQKVWKVELERADDSNEPELYFDLDGNFLFASTDINIADLPAEVTTAIETNYPGYQIIEDKVDRHDYPDGSVQYKVKIRKSGDDSKKELILKADGMIVCES